jgi:predicted nuclease of predicted toxin-antitoxin system
MRVLLDECVNPRVKNAFAKHEVRTVNEMGWGGITNGKLMALAQQSFDVFVTVDQNLEHQQNLAKLTLGLVVVAVPDNNIRYYRPIFAELSKAAESARPGQVIHIVSPELQP